MPWTEKHRPKQFEDIKGQDLALKQIKDFISRFHLGVVAGSPHKRKKSLVLHGPSGIGKTTIAHVIANETNSEIFELNASDLRNKEKLKEILRPAIEQQSLIKKNKIILVDEVDGISGYYDKGGIPELLRLIETTTYPVIITANDIWNKKLNPLRKISEIVQLKEINYQIIKHVLIDILKKQNRFIENEVLTGIAIKAKGDLRAAINDLQTIASIQNPSAQEIDERNKETDIFNSLRRVFKGKATNDVLGIFDSVNMRIDDIILWVEENIPREYQKEELAKAIEALSKADIFKGRIYRKQYWRFLVYENILLSYGIAASKDPDKTPNTSFTSYKKPQRILKIWLNNRKTEKKKSIAKKYAEYVHVGEKRALHEFPIIKQILKSDPEIQKELKLDEKEVEYLLN